MGLPLAPRKVAVALGWKVSQSVTVANLGNSYAAGTTLHEARNESVRSEEPMVCRKHKDKLHTRDARSSGHFPLTARAAIASHHKSIYPILVDCKYGMD